MRHLTGKARRLAISSGLILLLFLCGCGGGDPTGPGQTSSGKTLHVDPAAGAGGDGTADDPYGGLEEALAAAEDGDVISLAAGTYDPGDDVPLEHVVTLRGAGADLTRVEQTIRIAVETETIPVTIERLSCPNVRQETDTLSLAPVTLDHCALDSLAAPIAKLREGHELNVRDCVIAGDVNLLGVVRGATSRLLRCEIGGSVELGTIVGDSLELRSCDIAGDVLLGAVAANYCLMSGCDVDGDIVASGRSLKHSEFTDNTIGGDLRFTGRSNAILDIRDNRFTGGGLQVTSVACSTTVSGNIIESGTINIRAVSNDGVISGNEVAAPPYSTAITSVGVVAPTIRDNVVTLPYAAPSGLHVAVDTLSTAGIRARAVACGEIAGNTITGGAYGLHVVTVAGEVIANETTGGHAGAALAGRSLDVDGNVFRDGQGDGLIIAYGEGGVELVAPPPVPECGQPMARIADNVIADNGGAGVRLLVNADLGGGPYGDAGGNTLTGNGDYDLLIAFAHADVDSVYAAGNTWDHTAPEDIDQHDIQDRLDDPLLPRVYVEAP